MNKPLIINGRFNGPPHSGNGGYVCGVVAGFVEGTAEVTLRKPPPLDKPLTLRQQEGAVHLLDGDTLVAEGRRAVLELEPPRPPTLAEAKAAAANYTGFHFHIFPTCFVCGPQRPESDGLQIYPGQLENSGEVAAPWRPDDGFGDSNGRVLPEYVWAALDCPGAFAIMATTPKPAVLGRLTARMILPLSTNEEYIVTGWQMGQEGRKYYAGTAVYSEDGQLCALGQATWIEL